MSESRLTAEFWLDSLRREGAAFRAAVSADTLSAGVPSNPEWNAERLVGHLGGVYRFVAAVLARGLTPPPPSEDPVEAPTGAAVLDWWDDSFRTVVAALESADPSAPVWNWSIQEPVGRFWFRRLAHETAVHRWDAQLAAGAALTEPIETRLAVDGVDEALDTFLPSGHRAGPDTLRGVVTLRSTDANGHWAVRLRGAGVSLLDTDTVFDDPPHAQTAVSGRASDLQLALWGRVPFTVLTVEGNPDLPQALLVRC